MRRSIHPVLLTCVVPVAIFAGCAASRVSTVDQSAARVIAMDRQLLLDAALIALSAEGFPVRSADPESGILISLPVEGGGGSGISVRSLQLSSRPPTRRTAQVRVEEGTGGHQLLCRVVVEERAAEEQRLYVPGRRIDDAARDTAIDRDAATTVEQNTVWRVIGRDRIAERRILNAILTRTGGAPAPTAP